MDRRTKRLWIAVLLVTAGAALYVGLRRIEQPASPQGRTGNREELVRQFRAVEEQERAYDSTTWAAEMDALARGHVFVQLWDELRQSENSLAVLAAFSFGELTLPVLQRAVDLPLGIELWQPTAEHRTLNRAGWSNWVSKFHANGWKLTQSEWRQFAFFPETNGAPARSIYELELHANTQTPERRAVARGTFEVLWVANSAEVDHIRFQDLTLLQQSGPPAFQHAQSLELAPAPGIETLDPFLAAYDLNNDDLPELILGAQNAVLKREGEQFVPSQLALEPLAEMHVILLGHFDLDDHVDLLAADLSGLWIYHGDSSGQFRSKPLTAWTAPEGLYNPFVMTSGDVDADGDVDVYLTQYKLPYVGGQMPTPFYNAADGFPSFLLLNNGTGTFTDSTANSGIGQKRFRRTYSCSFIDLDRDADLDLVVVSDFYGIDLFLNDGTGRFADVTEKTVPEPHAFGMAHTFGDYNLDGALDILMLGMRSDAASRLHALGLNREGFQDYPEYRRRMTMGNRLYLGGESGFRETALSGSIRNAGWAWGATTFDFDYDSDEDVYVVNGHNSRASAADYESQFWRHDIYVANSELNGAHDLYIQSNANRLYGSGYSYGGFHKNKFFLNLAGTNFVEVAHLLGLAMEEDCRNLISADLDDDGDLDLAFTSYEQWPRARHGVHLFTNTLGSKAAFHITLREHEAQPGTRVVLHLKDGRTIERSYITGDSYRSQHAPTLSFATSSNSVARTEIAHPKRESPVR